VVPVTRRPVWHSPVMQGYAHRLYAPTQALALATLAHVPLPVAAIFAACSMPTSSGTRWSPDIDLERSQTRASRVWRLIAGKNAQKHRRLLHWIGLPAIVEVPLLIATLMIPYPFVVLMVVPWGMHNGWVSHLVADFAFGRRYAFEHRDAGIPLLPCSHHIGIWGGKHNWKSNGWTARLFAIVICPLVMLVLIAIELQPA
jgi:hypothetical protein